MIMTSSKDSIALPSADKQGKESRRIFYVQPPQGNLIVCKVNTAIENAFKLLKQQVHAESGIPSNFQHINRRIRDSGSLRGVPNESSLTVSIGLLGGIMNVMCVLKAASIFALSATNTYVVTAMQRFIGIQNV
jgi:hypothetical protein